MAVNIINLYTGACAHLNTVKQRMPETTIEEPPARAKSKLVTPLILGMAAPIFIYRTLGWNFSDISSALAFSVLVLGSFSGFACWLLPRRIAAVIALFYAGIPIGMIVDALFDFTFFHIDRNLLPFEILVMWAVAVIPIALGSVLGRWLRLRSERTKHLNA